MRLGIRLLDLLEPTTFLIIAVQRTNRMKIKKITHPQAFELRQARLDHAHITGQPMIERPHYYEHVETGQQYHELFGCIGWPNVITDKNKTSNKPGYIAIVGIIKNNTPPKRAPFRIMEEFENHNIITLFAEMLRMRSEFGFGLHPELLRAWFGDCDRFVTELALFNEELIRNGGEDRSIQIVPPDDFQNTKVFDIYIRAITRALNKDNQRLYYGGNAVLKNRVREFMDKDPVIMGMGGLIHSLLSRTMWLDQARSNCFVLEEG
jgi:hypothetical protein